MCVCVCEKERESEREGEEGHSYTEHLLNRRETHTGMLIDLLPAFLATVSK